jgi:hypothetical protein
VATASDAKRRKKRREQKGEGVTLCYCIEGTGSAIYNNKYNWDIEFISNIFFEI